MRGAKGVVLAFGPLRKAAEATQLAQGGHAIAPSGQDFVRVGLVAHVPDKTVARSVKHIVHGDAEFNGA